MGRRSRSKQTSIKSSSYIAQLWDQRGEAMLDFCALAALYSEAIEHREGPDGGVRFLVSRCHVSERDAREMVDIGRGLVGHLSVPRAEWDDARAAIATPLLERVEARMAAEGRI